MGIAKALAAKNGYELDSNQEVMLLKKGNVVCLSLVHDFFFKVFAGLSIKEVCTCVGVLCVSLVHDFFFS